MPNIIQIEELVYSRLPRISKSEWLKMLSKQGVANDYALLLDDYLLIEQTDYRFSNGNYISSERTVYNIDYTTYDTAENTPNPDNTEEIITVRYDSTHDRYYVYYTHFPIEDIPQTPDLSHILSEADIPSSDLFVQAPVEEQLVSFLPPKQQQPEPKKTQPSVSSTPSIPTTEYRKPWRQKRLAQLKELYLAGYTLRQIVNEFDCTPEGAIYQLKTYLGIEHPFEQKNDEPKAQQSQQPTPPKSSPSQQPKIKEKHIGRYTWDGEIVLSYLYSHPRATVNEIASSQYGSGYKAAKRDIIQCLTGYFSGYVEKDHRTGGYRLNQKGINEIRPYIESQGTPEISLEEYQSMLQHLHRSKNANGHIAPHKIILMLAIISYFKKHVVRVMEIDNDMKVFFMDYWRKYVHSDEWSPNIRMPWEHMGSEPFWHWVNEGSTTEAYLDDDLYYMIHHSKESRIKLKQTLLDLLK